MTTEAETDNEKEFLWVLIAALREYNQANREHARRYGRDAMDYR